jgi:hypothetical protein
MKALGSLMNRVKVEVSKFNLFSVKNENSMKNTNKNKSIDRKSKTESAINADLAILNNSIIDKLIDNKELEDSENRNKHVVEIKRYPIGDIINQEQLIRSIEDNSQIDESVIQQFL